MFIVNSGIDAASSDNVLVIVESSILEGNEEFTPSVTVTFQFSEVGVVHVCRTRAEELHRSSKLAYCNLCLYIYAYILICVYLYHSLKLHNHTVMKLTSSFLVSLC